MQRFQESVVNQSGVPVASPTITVRVSNTTPNSGVLASLYSDNGITGQSNPFTGDLRGNFFFYVKDGRYDIAITGGSPAITTTTIADIEVSEDVENPSTVAFSATPVFDLSLGHTQSITLTADVTSSTAINLAKGFIVFDIIQDAVGGWAFVWPTNVLGDAIQGTALAHNMQLFLSDGTTLRPVAPLAVSL